MAKAGDRRHGPGPAVPSLPALRRIAVLLRHVDDELAAMRREGAPDLLLSVAQETPDLGPVLGPLEEALQAAVDSLGLEPEPIDVRQRLRGPLHVLWADLIDMSPEYLEKRWGAQDVPEAWLALHRRLLAAVEEAITELGRASAPGTQ